MEALKEQVKDIPKALVGTPRRAPVLAIGVGVSVLLIVLFIEAFKPGLLTGPIKALLRKLGVKGAV
jgi:hypothetical protein